MIKKILLGVATLLSGLTLLLVGYVLSIKEDRPTADIEPVSTLHDLEYEESATAAKDWLLSTYQRNLFPSLSVAVGTREGLVWEGVVGFSDLNDATLASHNTQYRIGSVSKAITAAAAVRLHEKRIMDINSAFDAFVDDYPSQNSGFTVKQLLAHQGGVRHYTNLLIENFSTTEYASTREAASIIEKDALLFPPGEGFHYSTYGYTLVSLAMESAYAASFERLMHQEIFRPAGMTFTEFDVAAETSPSDKATPYLHLGESLYKAPGVNLSYKYAGGGYLSTPSDLVRFGSALLNNDLLGADAKALLWSEVPLNGEKNPQNYALGFRVGEDDVGRFVHHGGLSVGGYSFLLIYPDADIIVAFAANVTPSENAIDRLAEAKKLARFFGK